MYVYPYGDSQQLNLDWIINKLKELEAAGVGLNLEEVSEALISLTYNPDTLYARYDYAFLNGKVYRCLSGTSGAFDPDAWQEALIGDDLAVLTRWINALNAAAVVDVKFDTSGTNGKLQQKYNNAYHDVVEVDYTPVQNSQRPLSSNAGYKLDSAINSLPVGKVFHVGAGQAYTTLRAGIETAVMKPYSYVIVHEGTYDLATEFAAEISARTGTGIVLSNNVYVKFLSGTKVTALFPTSNTWINTYFAPFSGYN